MPLGSYSLAINCARPSATASNAERFVAPRLKPFALVISPFSVPFAPVPFSNSFSFSSLSP